MKIMILRKKSYVSKFMDIICICYHCIVLVIKIFVIQSSGQLAELPFQVQFKVVMLVICVIFCLVMSLSIVV